MTEKPNWQNNRFVIAGLAGLVLLVMLKTAWLGDDAYITFRVVDNFINGYGLVWNVTERVQVFTHPLWTLLVSAIVFITNEVYYSSIFISVALAMAGVLVYAFRISATLSTAVLGFAVLLTSKAFLEYSTSGLENALTYLLLALFYWQFFSSQESLKKLFVLSLFASLITLNRMDTILLCLPALVYVYWKLPKVKGALIGLAGFLPLFIWFGFAIVYYGFFLPNTYYAKLHTGISSLPLMFQGLNYYLNSIKLDPITLITIITGIVLAFRSKNWQKKVIGIGIVIYLLYIIRIGGDFMSGRFFAAPLLCALFLISNIRLNLSNKRYWQVVGAVIVLGVVVPRSTLLSGPGFGLDRHRIIDRTGIADERRYYYQATGLFSSKENDESPAFHWMQIGRDWKNDTARVQQAGSVGFTGYYAGPHVHVLDENALTDPLLARLPAYNRLSFRIGHFIRLKPPGYRETIETGQNRFEDASFGEFYGKLKKVVSGDIWDKERFDEILKFNSGAYDYLIEQGLPSLVLEVNHNEKLNIPVEAGKMWNIPGTVIISEWGVRVFLEDYWHADKIEMSVDHNDVYLVQFFNDSVKLYESKILDKLTESHGIRIDSVAIPNEIANKGYNVIEVYPLQGDGMYSIANIRPLDSTASIYSEE